MRPPVQNGGRATKDSVCFLRGGLDVIMCDGSNYYHLQVTRLRGGLGALPEIYCDISRKKIFIFQIALCSGIRVSTLSNMASSKAAFILEMALTRWATIQLFSANNESKEAGISYPVWAWESTTPGPLGQ